MLRYEPLGEHVIVKRIEAESERKSEGGIYMPDVARDPMRDREAIVLEVGPGRVTEHGHFIENTIKAGARVLIFKGRGWEIDHKGERALVIRHSDIMCTVHEEEG